MRPWLLLCVLVGAAGLGFVYVESLYRENSRDVDPETEIAMSPNERATETTETTETPIPRPPPEPQEATYEGVVGRVAKLSKRSFKKPVEFVPTTFDDIAQRITEHVKGGVPDAEALTRQRAYTAIGFVSDPFDYQWGLTGLRIERTGWYHNVAENKLYVNEDASLGLPEARGRLVRALMEVNLEQNYGLGDPGLGDSLNSDRALAAQSVLRGDAHLVRLHYSLSDVLGKQSGGVGSAGTPPPFYEAPVFMRERIDFTFEAGRLFHEVLRQQPDAGVDGYLDRVYSRMPVSTAEILHPVELYLGKEEFKPVEYQWDDLQVADADPFESNVAGEQNVRLLMKIVVNADDAAEIGDGWRGDRYVAYPAGEDGEGDHVFWRTHWATKEDAEEFAKGMQKLLLFRYSIPPKERYKTAEGFVIDDPSHPLRIRTSADGLTVQIVISSEESFADALEAKFGMP